MPKVCIIGAGLSGAVVAHQLASAGCRCEVFDSRLHVGGNCHTERDADTGVLMHVYGPHIFHTDDENVWKFICRFGTFDPFTNRVKATVGGRVYSLPINLLTINQFFGKAFTPEQARLFLDSLGDKSIATPRTFEEQALRYIGREMYEAFFRSYTTKQWGVDPSELPASILKRLPVRFNYDDNYYNSRFQGIPRGGYTRLIENILDHPNIRVTLQSVVSRRDVREFDHTFYTGSIDEWFGFCEGRLGYRTLDFVSERHEGDRQGCAVMNYCDGDAPWTRISEHKHFAPLESHQRTVISKEYSRSCAETDIPFYPLPLVRDQQVFDRYAELSRQEKAVTFVGRLATYRYLDMDAAIAAALKAAALFKVRCAAGN